MARTIYPLGAQNILDGTVGDLTSSNLKLALIDTGTYTYSAAHEFLDDISGVVATSGNLASITATAGVLDATSPVTISSVSGATVEAVILYKDTGSSATSPLLTYIDQQSDNSTAISFTPNGSDVDVTFTNLMDLIA